MSAGGIAKGLTKAQRALLRNHNSMGNMMGGWFGLLSDHPDMLEPVGINHPIFGSHYRLTPLGLAVRSALKENDRGE